MTNKGKNIYWINAVKAIAIIAVYLSHVSVFYGYSIGKVHAFINPWYVNAFFFISGYLLFRKQLKEPLITESKLLYISRNGGAQVVRQHNKSYCSSNHTICRHSIYTQWSITRYGNGFSFLSL